MELDGYSSILGLAFEHDGIQHREVVGYFHKSEADLVAQQERDKLKDELADRAQILLIRVPDRDLLPTKGIRDYVRNKLEDEAFTLAPKVLSDVEFMDRAAVVASFSKNYISRVAEMVANSGGLVTSEICPTRDYPVYIRCRVGHDFQTNFDNLERGRWCPHCAPNKKHPDEHLALIAQEMGLQFLGVESRLAGGKTRRFVKLHCAIHGESEQMIDNFTRKKGCAQCSYARRGKTKSLDQGTIDARMATMGLKFLTPYQTNSSETLFVCHLGHRFRSTFAKLSNGAASCHGCAAMSFQPLVLMEAPRDGVYSVVETYTWHCCACGTKTSTSIKGIKVSRGKGKSGCPNKSCQ
jgi:hypothetical protein